MTLEGAINFNETNNYTIFTMNSANAGQYCVVLPKNNSGTYNMLVDLHMKSLFDEVNGGSKTKEDLISEISSEYNKVNTKYGDAILVIPMFDEANYINIISTNDKQKMFDEVKRIGAITSELYKKLIDGGVDKQRIDQKIIILEKNDYDKKFVEWLTEQMPNFVTGVAMSEFEPVVENPFVGDNNIFGTPVVGENNVDNNNVVEVSQPVQDNVINSEAQPQEIIPPVIPEPIVSDNVVEVPNIFGEQPIVQEPPVQEPVLQPVQEQPQQPVQQPVVENPVIEEPKQVQSVDLGNTISLNQVNEVTTPVQQSTPVENGNVSEEEVQTPKKSNGFVNLAILLVVLVIVTIVSIELGKFLYNTYGV